MSITPKAPTPALPDGLTAVLVAAAPVDEVLGWLDSSEQGLSSAQVSARRARYGPNAVRTHHVNPLAVLGRQLRSAVLILLAATAVVSYFLGDSLQAIIIGVILTASIGLGFINEYRAERAAAALHSGVRHTAVVRRDGTFVAIDVTELVPGDVIRLSLGEAVPADLRLIEATGLECNESILTGESTGAEKSPQPVPAGAELAESSDLAFMGTIVSAGTVALSGGSNRLSTAGGISVAGVYKLDDHQKIAGVTGAGGVSGSNIGDEPLLEAHYAKSVYRTLVQDSFESDTDID